MITHWKRFQKGMLNPPYLAAFKASGDLDHLKLHLCSFMSFSGSYITSLASTS